MPTATDLVTDLPADFAVFGQAVATSMADLLGGTTGQILSKTSATDMDFTWTTPNPGDITGVTAGVGISGGGTSGDVTVTNSMATAMTTSGDLIQATGSGTFARLGTGTSGQYLTTNGTTNSWGSISPGGMTLISTTTLTGATVTLSSIPGTYKSLYYVIRNHLPASNGNLFMRFNADSGANRHLTIDTFGQGTATAFNDTQMQLAQTASTSANQALIAVTIPDYANATTWKMANVSTIVAATSPTTSVVKYLVLGAYNQTTAISSLSFFCGAGNFTSGTILLYGVS